MQSLKTQPRCSGWRAGAAHVCSCARSGRASVQGSGWEPACGIWRARFRKTNSTGSRQGDSQARVRRSRRRNRRLPADQNLRATADRLARPPSEVLSRVRRSGLRCRPPANPRTILPALGPKQMLCVPMRWPVPETPKGVIVRRVWVRALERSWEYIVRSASEA
jgi:hypothetical protein